VTAFTLPAEHIVNTAMLYLGWPVVALGIGILLAYRNTTQKQAEARTGKWIEDALRASAMIIMVTGLGGALSQILRETPAVDAIARGVTYTGLPAIFLPFVLGVAGNMITGSTTVGVITAFNFPVAVWSWNALVAAICGDTIVWKPSEKTPLTAVAVQKICNRVLEPEGLAGVFNLCCGGAETGKRMAADERLPLISATGSCRMGREVAVAVAGRMGRSLLELGGNNALIILDDADLDLALRAVLFGSLGTAGQRCTSTRRVLAQKGVFPALAEKLTEAFESVVVGDPLDPKTLVGPLIDEEAVSHFEKAVSAACDNGGELLSGGKAIKGEGCFVQPTLIKAHPEMEIVQEETFAPILYLLEADGLKDAISAQNNVRQGLSSAIFTSSMRDAERFLSVAGSDCGIANVNIGTSGAEIGGAFGGEKETGGGREAGSDSWKAYMRRQTCTVNYGTELPLAQGVRFDVE